MMRMKTKTTELSPIGGSATATAAAESEWEVRPGGMLVQKRNPDSDQNHRVPPPPTIRVRVKYGSVYHEINISSEATFGQLKKMLSGPTGLHHEDQKLLFKDKERDSKAFLDVSGVKDRSKMVLVEDPISKEKRYLEMRKNAIIEKACKSISNISLEVDRLAGQVSAIETVISRGGKVVDKDVLNITELLMNQLLKLDGITADGDAKLQRKIQVKRVQKLVETLDMLKMKNSMIPSSNGKSSTQQRHTDGQTTSPPSQQQHSNGNLPNKIQQKQQQSNHSPSGSVVITTQWETFDSVPVPPSTSNTVIHPKFNWDLL
ncbi:hypothetical protein LguiB_003615 [Lonicera macranthoides]